MRWGKQASGAVNPVRASFWYTICGVIQRAMGLVIVPIFTRIMPETDYGIYSLSQSWFYIASIFLTLNLAEYVFNNGMMKYEEDRGGFSASMLGLSTATTAIWFVLFFAAPSFWCSIFGLSAPVVFLIGLRCLISPCYSYWATKQRFEYRYKAMVGLTVALSVLTPLISVPLIALSRDKAIAALTCQVLAMAMVYLVPFMSIIRKSKKVFSKEYWGYALRFNIPLLPHFLALMGLQQSGRIIIGYIKGPEEAAFFSVAYSAAMVVTVVSTAVAQTLVPWTYRKLKAGRFGDISGVSAACLVVVGATCCCLILLAPEAMRILAPDSYQEGTGLIPPLCSSVVMMFLFNLFANVEYYYEETGVVAVASICAFAFNVTANVVCIPLFGSIAAGYVSLASYALFSGGHYLLMRRALRKHAQSAVVYDAKLLFVAALAFVCLGELIGLLYPCPLARYALLAAALAVTIVGRNKLLKLYRRIKG